MIIACEASSAMKTGVKNSVVSRARSSFRDGPWAGPGSHEHRLMSPFSEARVHGFRARGPSPRPGTTRRVMAPFSSQMAHAELRRAEHLTELLLDPARTLIGCCRGEISLSANAALRHL